MNALELTDVLDVLCPMHLILDETGHVLHAGPTAAKLGEGQRPLIGRFFFDLIDIIRPRQITTTANLRQIMGQKLHLVTKDAKRTTLKGIIVPLPGSKGRMIINLSFGISIIDGVHNYSLSNADFAATDLAIEMLYLVEAKTAAMEASRSLNLRLQGAKIAAEEQAFTDTLTGLKNRRAMDMMLNRLLATGEQFAVMHMDLDYFKEVNDTLGHAAGDHVLLKVAKVMVEETRDSDCVARVGGDEFIVILPKVKDLSILRSIGERIIAELEEPIPFEGKMCKISASIGTVWIETGSVIDKEQLLSNADVALYASKHAGRAQQTFYSPDLRQTSNAGVPERGRRQGRTT